MKPKKNWSHVTVVSRFTRKGKRYVLVLAPFFDKGNGEISYPEYGKEFIPIVIPAEYLE